MSGLRSQKLEMMLKGRAKTLPRTRKILRKRRLRQREVPSSSPLKEDWEIYSICFNLGPWLIVIYSNTGF
jgi:hypothetical protein